MNNEQWTARERLVSELLQATSDEAVAEAIANLVILNNPKYANLRLSLIAAILTVLTGRAAATGVFGWLFGWLRR
jgi:hypothetical protein